MSHPMDALHAQACIRDVLGSLESSELASDKGLAWLLRALRLEARLIEVGTAWPYMSESERAEIIERKFKGGRYPRAGEPNIRPAMTARRSDHWRALLGHANAILSDSGRQVEWTVHSPDAAPPDATQLPRLRRVSRKANLGQIRHAARCSPDDLDQILAAGGLWMWCDEGWFTTGLDLKLDAANLNAGTSSPPHGTGPA